MHVMAERCTHGGLHPKQQQFRPDGGFFTKGLETYHPKFGRKLATLYVEASVCVVNREWAPLFD
eukprot:14985207-Heterocapsa_arctica.AAC.1